MDRSQYADFVPASTKYDRTNARISRFKSLLIRRWWLVLLFICIGVSIGAYKASEQKVRYTAQVQLMIGGRLDLPQSNHFVRETSQQVYETNNELIQSPNVRERAVNVMRRRHPKMPDAAVEISVLRGRSDLMFSVIGVSDSKEYVVDYTNVLVDEFLAYRKELRSDMTRDAQNLVMEQVIRSQNTLTERQRVLDEFRAKNNMMLFEDTKVNPDKVRLEAIIAEQNSISAELDLQDRLKTEEDVQRRIAISQAQEKAANAATSGAPNSNDASFGQVLFPVVSQADLQYLEAAQKMRVLKLELESALQRFLPSHPEVLAIQEKIRRETILFRNLQETIEGEASARRKSNEVRLEKLAEQRAIFEERAKETAQKLEEFSKLMRHVEDAKEQHDKMIDTLKEIDTQQNMDMETTRVTVRATTPNETKPKLHTPLIAGGVSGLVLGLILILLLDQLDDRITSYSEFQSHFPGMPVFGQIPEQSFKNNTAILKPNDDRHLYAESFRNIRSSILFKNWGSQAPKSLLFTSAVPNEGKTTVVANLAITMAVAGAKVLLVDGDLRRGGLNELLGFDSSPGFSDILTAEAEDWRDLVRVCKDYDNLSFIPRGDALDQTSEYFLREPVTRFIEEAKQEYDYIIIDSAPVMVADDTASLAPRLDAVFFVMRMSSTMARLATKALTLLSDRQVNLAGVILNRAAANLREYSYYNYASYYTVQPSPTPGGKKENPAVAKK